VFFEEKPMSHRNRRLLVIDDNQAIHEDFRKILCRSAPNHEELSDAEADVFGADSGDVRRRGDFQVDGAFQGEEGIAAVRRALAEDKPYSVAFVDVRMPPGLDGVETTAQLFALDPDLQVVICTAFSDYSWEQVLTKLGRSDRLMILKKPFDTIEVLQLAHVLSQKWQRARDGRRHLALLQQLIRERSKELHGTTAWLQIDDSELELAAELADTRALHVVLENDLRRGLEAGELSVHYQPLVDLATQRMVSIEALARWKHPEKGWIPPAVFIPVAEQSGLILELGEFVLRTACKQVKSWQSTAASLVVAVNVSALQLRRQNMLELVRGVLRETGLRPEALTLEITESALIENLDDHLTALRRLRADGVSVAIDDFGTGYSSLSYLQRLPVASLKIDRSFVRSIHENSVDASIVQAITVMAHTLTMDVVAEGVETTAQLHALRALGCDSAQGYLFAPPLAPADFERLLAASASGGVDRPFWLGSQPADAVASGRVVNL
jgi:EAL domain-containing protein (putative c-di-GMP-specific phosphodiesterase class I)/DNA-binding NarL/FixJ family response regulator